MARRTWVLLAATTLMCALAVMMPLAAGADVLTNTQCLICHSSGVGPMADFEVGDVDKDTACRKCHLDSLAGSHPNHYGGGDCSAVCHRSWGPSLAANVPNVLTSAGSFASLGSPDTPAYILHAIHASPRWPASIPYTDSHTANSKCASCHAVASCTACHNGTPTPALTHEYHDNTGQMVNPWVGDISVGVVSSQSEDTVLRDAELRCAAPGCHDQLDDPRFFESFYHDCYTYTQTFPGGFLPTTASVSGTWSYVTGTAYTLGRERYSNNVNAELVVGFDGQRVALYATRDTNRGIGSVKVYDSANSLVASVSVDFFAATTERQQAVWVSPALGGTGPYTIKLRVTGQKNALSRGTWVSLDHIQAWTTARDTVANFCYDCHPDQADPDDHQGLPIVFEEFDHVPTQTIGPANIWNNGYTSHSCDQCHQPGLREEHRRPTASGIEFPDGCSVCHPHANPVTEATLAVRRDSIPASWTGGYDRADGCNFQTCHDATYDRVKHTYFASKHTPVSSGQSSACASCHPGDLRGIHNNSIAGNGKLESGGCLACHSPAKLDEDRSCSGTKTGGAACHSGGYNSIDSHAIKNVSSHEASQVAKPFTRAYQTTGYTIDSSNSECSLCHSSALITAHAGTVPAVGCATGGVLGNGCHMDTAYSSMSQISSGWTNRRCADCHNYGTPRTHDTTASAHLVASNGCAGSASNCHPSNSLWDLHKWDYFGNQVPGDGCAVAGCHDPANKNKRPSVNFANSCGSTSGGCHSDFSINHPDNYQHAFTSVSYYNGATETGCTNQTGCHNAGVSSTADFGAPHHPNSGCLSGVCHGSNPTQAIARAWKPIDCQECHTTGGYGGSAYQGAAPRTLLTNSPASGGHYNATAHTAASMTTSVTAGGTASARCEQCHNPALDGSTNGLMNQHQSITIGASPYGSALTCGECHGDTRSKGNAQVVAKWTNNLCSDCHSATGSTSPHDHATTVPAVNETGTSCGSTGDGCHNTADLHALHKNDPGGCSLTGCHVYTQQVYRPTAKSCGGATSCHTGYTNTNHGSVVTGNEALHTAVNMTAIFDPVYNAGGGNTCNTCHSAGLEAAHAPSITGNLGWTTPTCLSCHNATTPVNAVNVIKNLSWSAQTCEQCHGAPNGPAKHAEYATGHTGVAPGHTCGQVGCHNTWDLRQLHNNSLPTNSIVGPGCAASGWGGCHALNKDMKSPAASKTCGEGNGACHPDKNDSNHGAASAHGFTEASWYDAGTESGCTAQPGCHNQTGASTGDFASPYHPDSGCNGGTPADRCHLPTNPSKSTYSGNGDCVTCHNGSYQWAGTKTPITSAPPAGHYSETTHTALGMTTALNFNGGTASATCNDCHPPTVGGAGNALANQHTQITIPGSPYGSALACGECHGDLRLNSMSYIISRKAPVNPGWTNRLCIDCHAIGNPYSPLDHASSVPEITESGSSCGNTGLNCHPSNGLHEVHKNAAGGCNLSGCHNYGQQANVPTARSCVAAGCHAGYTNTTHSHTAGGGDAAKHQPTTLTQANASQFGVACGECHDIRNSNSSLTLEHALATSAKSLVPGDNCRNCHNNAASTTAIQNNWATKDTTGACAACHAGALAIHPDENIAAHSTEANTGCASTGIGCHNGVDLSRVGPTNAVNTNIHNDCRRCHDRNGATAWSTAMIGTAANLKYDPAVKTCGQATGCHTSGSYNPANGYHRVGRGDVVDGNDAKHTAVSMTTTIGAGPNAACSSCHSAGLTNAHPASMTGWSNVCTGCHNSTLGNNVSPYQVKGGWTTDQCSDCHAAGTGDPNRIGNWHLKYTDGSHDGVSTQPSGCVGACHKSGMATDLGVIHSTAAAGCAITGCHAANKDMTSAPKSCGPGGACHTDAKYADGGSHGFSVELHTTTDQNSWKNCGRCHLGYRADYTRTGTFNGHLQVDSDSPTLNELHRNSSRGGNGCVTCHDGGPTQAKIDAGATANCVDCHVDHRLIEEDKTPYTTTSTSPSNVAKTIMIDFTGMRYLNLAAYVGTSDNTSTANIRIEVGPVGSPLYSTGATSTTAMDPLRKKYYWNGINAQALGITGVQPVRLYVWSGKAGYSSLNDKFEVMVSRGDMVYVHTADVQQFTCSFGDCHDSNIVAMHDPYEIPGAFTGNYTFPTNPTRENNSTVQGGNPPVANQYYKVKSITLNLDDIDRLRIRLNLYCADSTARTLSFRVQIGGTILKRVGGQDVAGSYTTNTTQRWWDFSPTGTDPSGATLSWVDVSGYSGAQTIDLWLASNRATSLGAARNNTFQIWSGERVYEASTPTDACDLCHLSTIRRDRYGNEQSNDTSLGPETPKLAALNPQCDTCHPHWEDGHPQFGHQATSAADTCLNGCHRYSPAITGTDLGRYGKYDLTKQHKWGDNSGAGLSYTPGTSLVTDNFGTTTTWPSNWTRSDATYVTNQTGSSRSGAAPQIGVNTTRTEYNFRNTSAFDTSHYPGGGLVRFWYQVNVGDTSDYLAVDYATDPTGPWTEVWRQDTDALTWTQSPYLWVPRSSTLYVRFRGTFNTSGEYGRVDDFTLDGAIRTFPGEMENGCAVGPNGACHNQKYPTTGKCSDCHSSINHHNVVHDLTVGGTRPNSNGVATGFTLDSCLGTCHQRSLHYLHGVALTETDPRPYRAPGDTSDSIMSCATCHDSANATIKTIANSAATPIADKTLKCSDCHTGTSGMASAGHAGVSTSWRTGQPLRGANPTNEFSNTTSVSGHRVAPYTNAFDPDGATAGQQRWYVTGAGGAWYMASGTGRTRFDFNNFTAAPGATNAAGLLRSSVLGPDGTAGTAVPLKAGGTSLTTSTVIHCADCHGESAANLDGPQGAATNITMLEGFTTRWIDQTNNQNIATTLICNRCHNIALGTASTSAHKSNGGHVGTGSNNGRCINCHIAIPHAWKRPKLLARAQTDPVPYVVTPLNTSTTTSLNGWGTSSNLASTTFNSSGNCNSAGCRSHSGSNTMP